MSYTHDTDGFSVGPLDLSTERERLKREQRKLSRKEHESANYRTQRRVVAQRRPEAKALRHPIPAFRILRLGIRPCSCRKSRRERVDEIAVELSKSCVGVVENVSADARIQMRTRRYALRSRRSTRDDQRVFGVRRRNHQTTVGSGTLVPLMRV